MASRGPKIAEGVLKGVYPRIIWRYEQLLQNRFMIHALLVIIWGFQDRDYFSPLRGKANWPWNPQIKKPRSLFNSNMGAANNFR